VSGKNSPKHDPPEAVELTVVVPVFDEEGNLDHLHERLTSVLENHEESYELLFIEDGSTDSSFAKLRALHESDRHVRVVRFVRNFGQQMAVAAGFRYARGNTVVLIDADLQTRPEDIPRLCEKLAEGYDIVYGVRGDRQDPLVRRVGSWAMSHLLFRITGIGVPDSSSGFIALDRRFVESVKLYGEKSKYFNGLFAWLSYGRAASVRVEHLPRTSGTSKYTFRELVSLALNFICSFSVLPLRFAAYVGGVFFLLGCIGMLGVLGVWLFASQSGGLGLWMLVAVMAAFSGVQLMATGMLGEYLGRVYTEVRERPEYVVREVLDHEDRP
jgi:dolichol-phosphate mannosyltransferase